MDILRKVAWIKYYRSGQNEDKGREGVLNPRNFADIPYGSSITGGRGERALPPPLRCAQVGAQCPGNHLVARRMQRNGQPLWHQEKMFFNIIDHFS